MPVMGGRGEMSRWATAGRAGCVTGADDKSHAASTSIRVDGLPGDERGRLRLF